MCKSPVLVRKTAKNLGKRCVFRGFCRGQHFYPRNMVRTKGLAPLRRAPVNSPPGCSVCSHAFHFLSSFRKPLALTRASPLKPLRSSISYQKRDGAVAPSLFWCGRRDLRLCGAPRCTARRADAVCAPACPLHSFPRKPLTRVRVSPFKSLRIPFFTKQKNGA